MTDKPVRRCEKCGGSVAKIISSSGIVFKGTGWYVTDYSKKMKENKTESNGDKKAAKAPPPAPSSKKSTDK